MAYINFFNIKEGVQIKTYISVATGKYFPFCDANVKADWQQNFNSWLFVNNSCDSVDQIWISQLLSYMYEESTPVLTNKRKLNVKNIYIYI